MHKLFRHKNLIVAAAFLATMALTTVAAHAQLVGELEANIPFAFHADNARLPAGEYYLRQAEDMDINILEIESANKNMAAFVLTESSQPSPVPRTSELTFDKIGNQYFLRGITVDDSSLGYTLVKSKAEVKAAKHNAKIETHKLTVKHNKVKISKR